MTEPDPAAEWEPDDEPDTTSDGPPKPDETASVGPPATEPPEAPPGMKYDDNGKLVDADTAQPRSPVPNSAARCRN